MKKILLKVKTTLKFCEYISLFLGFERFKRSKSHAETTKDEKEPKTEEEKKILNNEKHEKTETEHEKDNKNERKRERQEKNEKEDKQDKEKKQQTKRKIYGLRQSLQEFKAQFIKLKNDFQEFNQNYNIKPKHYFNTLLLLGFAVLVGIHYYDPFSTISYEVNIQYFFLSALFIFLYFLFFPFFRNF